jgi:hypothetical protein
VYEVARPASPTQELGWWASAWRGRLCFVTLLANKDKHEYGHRCDQQDGEHDGPNQRRMRSRLFVMVCHRGYSRRQLFANAAIAASRVAVCRSRDYPAWVLDVERAGRRFGRSGLIMGIVPEKDFDQRRKVSRLKNSALQLAAVSRPVSAETGNFTARWADLLVRNGQ